MGEPDSITHEFILTLPLGQDTSFLLGINAVAEETSKMASGLGLPAGMNLPGLG